MENFIQKIKKLHDLIVFDEENKAAGRARLAGYLRGAEAVRARNVVRLSSYKSPILTIIKNKYIMPILAVALLVALLGGGTSFAAEGALPGDLLYPVKIKVNEQVASALTFSARNKAEFEAHLAEKRLKEASALAAEGRLDSETEAELEGAFESSAGKVEIHLKSLESSGSTTTAAEIGARFDDILRAYIAELGKGTSTIEALGRISDSIDIVIKTSGRDHDEDDGDNSENEFEDESDDDLSGDRDNRDGDNDDSDDDEDDDISSSTNKIEIKIKNNLKLEDANDDSDSSSSDPFELESEDDSSDDSIDDNGDDANDDNSEDDGGEDGPENGGSGN